MKKRFISLLLTVLMVLSLFSGLSVNAYAATTAYGANTIEYTMGQGDYVLRICQKLGLNYYTCKDAIMILNNIYDGQWSKLAVGRVLTLPASDNDAVLIANGARTTTYNSGAAATTASTGTVITGTATTGTVSTANSAAFTAAKSADTLAYYLVPYTMSYGETVSGVCNNLGVNFSIFNPFIKQVNNISDWSKVRAGDTIIVPTPVCPVVGTTCYGVMQHVVTGSDTAYGIVSSKGVNYNANELLLKALNQTDNLAAIRVGSNFFYPVPLTVSVPGTGNPGSTATTTTVTTVSDGNGTTTTSTTTTSKLYTLTSGMAASDGTMLFYVNNQAVTAAPAGAKVTIATQTYSGRAVQSLTVKYSDGKADLHLTGDTFVMPSCNVRVDTAIKTGHDINISANYSGKASASVGGVSVSSAVKGAAVVIKSVDPNYEISAVYASYKKLITASTKTALTVSSSNAFIMPDTDVDVEVVLKPVSTYAFYVIEPTAAYGSFYLQVNGSSVTRAAKGAQVTVVPKAIDGYEPVGLNVYKHGTSQPVNVFSNTFTMPAFDVDVEVVFGAKGNNVVIMPSQIASVYAFDKTTFNTKSAIASIADVDDAITEASSNTDVYLVAVAVDENDPDKLKDLDRSDYSISYDIVRNSDGLKISAKEVGSTPLGNAFTFVMPKGGVTVTPVITAKTKVNIVGEIYRSDYTNANGSLKKADKYLDCSFSVTYQTAGKDKRVEYTGKVNPVTSIPALEYVDLRFDSTDSVAFVKYEVAVLGSENDAEQSEMLTNEANLHGYFQIPVATSVTIKAFFETGKASISPAVITGIGSVGYKIQDANGNWKSSNTCEPGEDVMLVVFAGNGYKFDDSKFDTKLIVTRKDNGAKVQLTRVGAGISFDPPDVESYAYTFKMPASGVNVQATFDPKPFEIWMKCVDEVGNDLTGQGLWQIAINWVPGVLDNATDPKWLGFDTKFDVAYGDYVTVAMTEAGWSKYDMVSFRIDDQQYTADQLNYFYNFQMIDDRACDHVITAVLRPKTVSAIHNLNAMYDVTKGGVEFMIIDSPSHYSDEFRMNSTGALNYVNRAIAGDKVAIVVNSVNNKYTVKASDINIIAWGGDADRIVPTEEYIDAFGKQPGTIRVFTFTMPDSDVNVTVNYSGAQRGLVVSVYDADNNSAPVSGMVRVFANNVYRDVGSDFSFADIAYKTPVQILRSELALAENKVIRDVEISTGSGKSVPYTDMTNAGEGIQFTMPDEPVWVIIRIADRYYPNVPTVVIDTQVNNGTFVYRKSANTSDPVVSLADFAPGETVYVFDEPYPGYDHLGLGDLKIYVNGVQNTVNVQQVDSGSSDGRPHIWSFTMPQGTIIMKADFPLESADEVKITVAINPATIDSTTDPTEINVIINGYTSTLKSGDSFTAYEGSAVTISACTDGYSVSSVLSGSKKGVTGNVYVVPGDLDALKDTLTVTLTKDTYPIQWSVSEGGSMSITSGSSSNIVSAKANDKITVEVKPNDGYELANGVITVSSLSGDKEFNLELVDNKVSFEMPAEGVKITANFTRKAEAATVQFMAVGDNAKLTMSLGSATVPADGSVYTWQFPVDTVITVAAENAAFDKIDIAVDGSGVVKNNTFTVKGDAKVLISFSSSKNAISAKSSTGSISFYSDDALKNAIGSAEAGQKVYILSTPNTGYSQNVPAYPKNIGEKITDAELAAWKKIIKIAAKTDGKQIELKATEPAATEKAALYFEMPAGGVDVTASYQANSITISFNIDNSAVPDAAATVNVKIGDSSIVVENGKSITATVGQKVVISSTNSKAGIGSVTPTVAKQSAVSGSTFTVPATDVATEVLTVKLSKGSSLTSGEWNFFSAEEDNAAAENDALNDAGEEYEEPAAYDEAAEYEEAPAENEAPAAYEPAPEQTED